MKTLGQRAQLKREAERLVKAINIIIVINNNKPGQGDLLISRLIGLLQLLRRLVPVSELEVQVELVILLEHLVALEVALQVGGQRLLHLLTLLLPHPFPLEPTGPARTFGRSAPHRTLDLIGRGEQGTGHHISSLDVNTLLHNPHLKN